MSELITAMRTHASQRPAAIAIRDAEGRQVSWKELAEDVDERGSSLVTDQKSFLIHENHNSIHDVVTSLACLVASVCEVSIDGRFPAKLRQEMVRQSESFVWETFSDDPKPAIVLWTSGTTDRPQGVMLSTRNLDTNARAKLKAVPQDIHDIRLTLLPISHAYARTCDMGTWLLSGCQWTIDLGTSALDRIHFEHRPTLINGPPSIAAEIVQRLDDGDPGLQCLRILGCGGAAIQNDTFEELSRHGIETIQGYGCTETSPVICSATPGATTAGFVGQPVEGWETKLRNGRLFVRGPGVMLGYLNDVTATQQKIDVEGWFDTGDLVEMMSDGTMRVLGRADDVIVMSNGFKIYPQSVERSLQSIEGVQWAVLIGGSEELIVAIQSEIDVLSFVPMTLKELLPPGTRYRVETIAPPLSFERNELTAKGTPRRSEIVKRFRV